MTSTQRFIVERPEQIGYDHACTHGPRFRQLHASTRPMYLIRGLTVKATPVSAILAAWFTWSLCSTAASAEEKRTSPASPTVVLRTVVPDTQVSVTPQKTGLTRDDFRYIAELLPAKTSIVAVRNMKGQVRHDERQLGVTLVGTTDAYFKIAPLEISRGRFLGREDETKRNNVAVIDFTIAQKLFLDEDPIGQTFQIDQQAFVVAGISGKRVTRDGLNIFIPLSTMRARFGDYNIYRNTGSFEVHHYELSEIHIELSDPLQLKAVTSTVRNLLAATHDSQDYSIQLDPLLPGGHR